MQAWYKTPWYGILTDKKYSKRIMVYRTDILMMGCISKKYHGMCFLVPNSAKLFLWQTKNDKKSKPPSLKFSQLYPENIQATKIDQEYVIELVFHEDYISGLTLSLESEKYMFQMSVYLHTNTGLPYKQRFYISTSAEGVVVVSINYRDTYIAKNNLPDPILCDNSNMVLLSLSKSDKVAFQTSVYLHINTGLSDEQRFYISPSVELIVVVSINHRYTYISKKTLIEPILREESIFGFTFIVRSQQSYVSNNCLSA